MGYEEAVAATWRHLDLRNIRDDYTNLIHYATLAASSHNTQPWKFHLESGRVKIRPDFSRRCPGVDPDDHHLYASLGCAAENLLQAAAAAGLYGHMTLDRETSAVSIRIDFDRGPAKQSDLFKAIPRRQCSRTVYDGSPAAAGEIRQLEAAGHQEGVSVLLLTGDDQKAGLIEFLAAGNIAQIGDVEWKDELISWIRFNERHAVTAADGLYGKSMGSPNVPRWLGKLILRLALTPKMQNKKDRESTQSSAGVAVFVADADDREHWIKAGQCYERFALQATALGLRTALINPPVEVPDLRPQFAAWLGIGDRRPNLVVRFGRGPEMPRSMRRPLEAVIE